MPLLPYAAQRDRDNIGHVKIMDRLAALDRRVGDHWRPADKAYDAPVPWWLTQGWLLGPLMIPLVVFAGPASQHPWRILVVFFGVVGAWVVSTVLWARRHRMRE